MAWEDEYGIDLEELNQKEAMTDEEINDLIMNNTATPSLTREEQVKQQQLVQRIMVAKLK